MSCESCGHENLQGAHFCAKCGVQLASNPDDKNWVGRLVGGRFRVNKVLGEGGMGVVYEGEQQMGSTVRRVAIKTLHSHLSNDASVLARFHRECGTVSELEHPNTIKFYDFGKEEDGTLYIAMEYLAGSSLDKIIDEEGALPPSRTVKVMKQICGALDEAHDKGVIHRDLKPENIVIIEKLGQKDFVKVLDFGIAARSESSDSQKEAKLTQQGMVLGTPPYMSPEQFTGVELDRRSDVYSLGVMAYEMLTAHLPFTANTPWQWATQHMTAQPFPMDQVPSGSAVPRPMREAVMRALSKDPNARPATAGAFLKELEAGLQGLAGISAPTEQMQAAPVFSLGSVPASVPGLGRDSVVTNTQSEMSATQPIEIPTTKSSGPLLAAIALVALLVFGGAYFAMGKGKKTPDVAETPDPSAANTGDTDPPPTDEKPPEVVDKPLDPTSSPSVSPQPAPSPKPLPGPTPAPRPTPKPVPAPEPAPKPEPAPEPKPDPKPTPADECKVCISSVNANSWGPATKAYSQCSDTGQSACRSVAKKAASTQVTAAIKRGDCARAKGIEAEAAKMGASSSSLKAAAQKCK